MNHLMIDIETLGRRPGCIVLSIGAVVFNEETILCSLHIWLDVEAQKQNGQHMELETVMWWLNNGGYKQAEDVWGITRALDRIASEIYKYNVERVWANSPSFDLSILKWMFDSYEVDTPWEFWQERDVRTMKAYLHKSERPLFAGKKHDARQDALHQIDLVRAVWWKYGLKRDLTTSFPLSWAFGPGAIS